MRFQYVEYNSRDGPIIFTSPEWISNHSAVFSARCRCVHVTCVDIRLPLVPGREVSAGALTVRSADLESKEQFKSVSISIETLPIPT
jgi:hypothetical protein